MTKQEIENKLEQAKKDRDTTAKSFALEITDLRWQLKYALGEAEKPKLPKLRHGDFGCYKDDITPVAIMTRSQSLDSPLNIIHKEFTLCNVEPRQDDFVILGNIFDLLKDEDFKEFLKRNK